MLRGRSILVVENELLIAMDIAQALEQAGANATMTTTARHALILIEHDGLAGAIMDHGLTDGDSTQVCAMDVLMSAMEELLAGPPRVS